MKKYNWALYDAWCQTAQELGIALRSKNGGAVYMDLPKEIDKHFFWILWTPLNAYHKMGIHKNNDKHWQDYLWTLKDNECDFHIEASLYDADDESHYAWFPEINHKPQEQITKEDIKKCVLRMLDKSKWPKQNTLASLY